jgi:hypothetical protein
MAGTAQAKGVVSAWPTMIVDDHRRRQVILPSFLLFFVPSNDLCL